MIRAKPLPKTSSPEKRPTSYDVARRAGVSQSAVSRCFRAGGSIAPETRDRVLRAARELGYWPNAIASGLITKRSNLVAVLISNLTNLYYPEVLAKLTRRLDAHGIRVLLFAMESEYDVDAALDQVWRYRVDGAIVAARLSRDQIDAFARHHVPAVLYNRLGPGVPVPSVCCDSAGGERLLVDALLKSGHRHFGIIGGPPDNDVGRQRVDGALSRLREAGLTPAIATGSFDHDSGARGFDALMAATRGHVDAVVCANDPMAIGAMDAARGKHGLDVPRDVSIAGFDGIEPASWGSYALTTIRQPVGRMTEAAVAMLIERIGDPGTVAEVRTFAGELIVGASARLD